MVLQVRQFPCLQDNYGFLIHCSTTGACASIDTPDAGAILTQTRAAGWTLSDIWNTHHHWDHVGGNDALRSQTGAVITAPEAERAAIGHVDRGVRGGDRVQLGAHTALVLDVGGHTLGHVAYYFEEAGVAFVGDALFALGCGRMFEGTPEQMQAGLQRLRDLPADTTVYCAHEYTCANARFALSVDPDNPALIAYAKRVEALRARNTATVPTLIAAECEANPFLRWDDPGLRRRLGLLTASNAEVFAELRRLKDAF